MPNHQNIVVSVPSVTREKIADECEKNVDTVEKSVALELVIIEKKSTAARRPLQIEFVRMVLHTRSRDVNN